ncbi:hypothetical protein F5Y17DRAFT_443210 [Xylariaceae sp. FL0594]|nr:hypothetical protein F5Y17DRAFT_443210 [Xylariaceae sp. FL0594]
MPTYPPYLNHHQQVASPQHRKSSKVGRQIARSRPVFGLAGQQHSKNRHLVRHPKNQQTKNKQTKKNLSTKRKKHPTTNKMCWKQEYSYTQCGHRVIAENEVLRKCASGEAYGHACFGSFDNAGHFAVRVERSCCPACRKDGKRKSR